MAQTDKHFRLRISEGLHLQVELAARASGRSLNAEIVHLIEAGLAPAAEPTYTAAQVAELLAALEARRLPGQPLAVPDAGLVANLARWADGLKLGEPIGIAGLKRAMAEHAAVEGGR